MTEVVATISSAWRTRRGWWRCDYAGSSRGSSSSSSAAATTSTRARRAGARAGGQFSITDRYSVLRERIEHTDACKPNLRSCRGGVPPLKGKTRRRSSSTGGAGHWNNRRTASHRAQLQVSRFQVGSCVRESSGRAGRGAGAIIPTSCWMGQGRNHSLDPRCGWLDRVGFYSGSEDRPTKLDRVSNCIYCH